MSNYLFKSYAIHPTFTCPHCFKISSHRWEFVYGPFGNTPSFRDAKPKHPFNDRLSGIIKAMCSKCNVSTYWLKSQNNEELQVYPSNSSNYPQPHEDMPEHIKKTFIEAGSVMHLSLGSSAALSRLTLENLLKHLGYEKGSLNDKIGKVIADEKVNSHVAKMLDIIRAYGNSGAHSGIINLDENPEIPNFLLELINLVVEHMITLPNKVDTMFDAIPPGIKAGIEKRDAVKQ
ncbi:DUF4145 domain-containing protein [Bacillus toyonensis]|uniref:DUF4145 domain-containing protein n=1 Tax=Bacillus toyonensis TaxID=155322 RepID=UPI000BED6487|nr:DUF4145 domain-containing protein [Bacillus toyonensis]PEF99668.1 hypothetical protein COO01_04710 [Bacillus toyonensis]